MKKFLIEGKKVGGYVLLETVLAMIAFSMLSMAFFTIFSGQFSMINSSADAMQAQQYAEIDAQKLRLMNYYDLDDEGAKSRSAMTSWSNPNNLWEDEITIGNEIVIDDYTQSKQRIATIKIYRQGDTLPRFSFEVPVSSQGSGVPIGSIVAWGTDTNPSYDGGTYLECDGSTFDRNKYKRLYEVLGTDKLPNYQGMFLRGAGSQSYAQVNGYGFDSNNPSVWTGGNKTSTTYSSGNVGEVQGDSLRRFTQEYNGTVAQKDAVDVLFSHYIGSNRNGTKNYLVDDPEAVKGYVPSWISIGGREDYFEDYIFNGTPKHYRIQKHFSTFTTEDGRTIRYLSDVDEIETPIESTEGYKEKFYFLSGYGDTAAVFPTANEIRPVNVAVKFMIKAK